VLVETAERAGKGTSVRVAGGWVRDKLLGLPSHDIDVCLDTVSRQRCQTLHARRVSPALLPSVVATSRANPVDGEP
jgi:tRNA nucleotidyltransferase/poly(A) polymerase